MRIIIFMGLYLIADAIMKAGGKTLEFSDTAKHFIIFIVAISILMDVVEFLRKN